MTVYAIKHLLPLLSFPSKIYIYRSIAEYELMGEQDKQQITG
jgi:hypothetical protein